MVRRLFSGNQESNDVKTGDQIGVKPRSGQKRCHFSKFLRGSAAGCFEYGTMVSFDVECRLVRSLTPKSMCLTCNQANWPKICFQNKVFTYYWPESLFEKVEKEKKTMMMTIKEQWANGQVLITRGVEKWRICYWTSFKHFWHCKA